MVETPKRCEIRFLPSGRRIELAAGEMTLLEAIQAVGLPIASACAAAGACARCGVEIVSGAASLATETERERRNKLRNRVDAHLRLACLVEPTGDLVVRASYW
jgi:ferredoxin